MPTLVFIMSNIDTKYGPVFYSFVRCRIGRSRISGKSVFFIPSRGITFLIGKLSGSPWITFSVCGLLCKVLNLFLRKKVLKVLRLIND